MPNASLVAQYRASLLRHLPPGKALTRSIGSPVVSFIGSFAPEFARVHGRALDLLREAFPPDAVELLPMWELVLDLPDECFVPTTLDERQAAVRVRLVGTGGHGRVDYESLARALGYTILEWGRYEPFTVDSSADDLLFDDSWAHAVRVRTTAGAFDALLECAFRRQRRSHSVFHFEFVAGDELLFVDDGEQLLVDDDEPLVIGV